MRRSWLGLTLMITTAAAAQSLTLATITYSLSGGADGLPGDVLALKQNGTVSITTEQGSNPPGPAFQIIFSFFQLKGSPTTTDITIVLDDPYNDVLVFHDSSPSLSLLGRSGTANLTGSTGSFHGATGYIQYDFSCTQVCPDGVHTPIEDHFGYNLSGLASIVMAAAGAQQLPPSTWPVAPPVNPLLLPGAASNSYRLLPGGGVVIISPKDGSVSTQSVSHLNAHPATSSTGSPDGSFTLTPPWQPVQATFAAAATCADLSAGCWLTVPSGTGSLPPLTSVPIPVDLDYESLPEGIYPANLSLTVTPAGGAASVQNLPFTLVISNGAPELQLSDTGIQFQAVTGSLQTPSIYTISLRSTGSPVTYTSTASTLTGGNWLTVQQASGSASSTATGSIDIQANPNGLAAGAYFGRVDISAPGAFSPLQSIPVTLTVAAAASANPILSPTA